MLHDTETPTLAATVVLVSHIVCGIIVSPLELVQTRMVLQTSKKGSRKYKSTLDALITILRDEHAYNPLSLVLSPNMLIPSTLYHSFNTVFKYLGPLIGTRLLGIDYDYDIVSFFTFELIFGLLETFVMSPIETIRRRLMCQVIAKPSLTPNREFQTVVETSPIPYTDPFNCLVRIISEEGCQSTNHSNSDKRSKKRRRRSTANSTDGVFGGFRAMTRRMSELYRGVSAKLTSSLIVLCLRVLIKSIEILDE